MDTKKIRFTPQCVSHELTDLKDIPHVDIAGTDLAIAATYKDKLVTNEDAMQFGMSPEDVIIRNGTARTQYHIDTISNALGVPEDGSPRLYVLSNEKGHLGATILSSREKLVKAKMTIGENFYVLPSSIHECIAVPDSLMPAGNAQDLQQMVASINAAEVLPSERLSNSVYHFSGRELTPVAGPALDYVRNHSFQQKTPVLAGKGKAPATHKRGR